MTPSENAEKLLESFEGCVLEAYRDIRGIPTIGYGHTRGVKMGDMITGETAGLLLLEDLDVAVDAINDAVKVPLTQNQFDALCSFVYNIGVGAFRSSTMLKRINAGDFAGAAAEFPRWKRAGAIESPGLLRRRMAEQALFMKGAA